MVRVPHCSPEKQFQSINTFAQSYDYTITLNKREKKDIISFFRIWITLPYLFNVESPSPKDALWQVWLKVAHWFRRRRFRNFLNVFSLFRCYYLLLGKGVNLHLNKHEFPSAKGQGDASDKTKDIYERTP